LTGGRFAVVTFLVIAFLDADAFFFVAASVGVYGTARVTRAASTGPTRIHFLIEVCLCNRFILLKILAALPESNLHSAIAIKAGSRKKDSLPITIGKDEENT
jgi:hypothetical protein